MKLARIITLFLVSLTINSCEKVSTINCNINIETRIQTIETDEITLTDKFSTYILFADTANFEVTSYADAKDGVFTNRKTSEKVNYNAIGTYDYDNYAVTFNELTNHDNIILIVDTEHKRYAYKYQELATNLPVIYLEFYMPIWKFEPSTGSLEGTDEFLLNKWLYKKDEE